MSEGLDDLEDLMSRAEATQWGKACSALWAQAAALAEEQGDLEKAVVCYDELATAYMMGGELTRCIAPFMWLERMYKLRPELFNEDLVESLAADYKFALSAVRSVPTIPFEQCMSLLEETERFHRSMGDSMHCYYMRAFQLFRDMGMMEDSDAAYQRWLAAESSRLSDCSHCDPGHRVRYHAERGEWAEAMRVGDEALNSDKHHCGAQPEALLTDLLETFLRCGRDDEAWAAHIRGYRRYQQASRYFEYHEQHLRYLALAGRAGRPQRLERGVKILLRHMPWWREAETPQVLMDTAVQGFVLLDSFGEEHADRILPVTLPGEELQWITRPTLVNPTLAQARDWMRDLALAMADEFDARPGHPHPGVMRARVELLMDPEPIASLTQEGVIEDASGLGDYTMMSTFEIADGTIQAASVDTDAQAEPTAAPNEEEEPPLVPLPLNGPWQSMSFMELLEAAAEYGEYVPTVYVAMAREIAFQDPSLIDPVNRPQTEGRVQQYWDAIVEYVNQVTQNDAEVPDYPRVCEDRAYQLLQESDKMLDQRKYMEAAQLADDAMRTPSVEPIGVRLEALTNLSMAASFSGYLEESVASLRELINLNALLGLRVDQAGVSILLTDTLHKLRRYTEATEVAQSGLDIFERYPHIYGPAVELNRLAALANAQFSNDAAANRHFAAGKILERNEIWRGAAGAYGEAADGYTEGHEYAQAIVARDLALRAARLYFAETEEALKAYRAKYLGAETPDERESTVKVEDAGDSEKESIKDSAEEEVLDNYKYAIEQLLSCLLDYAHILVWQPGNISDEDFARMEELMNELRAMITNPTFDEYMPKTAAWRDADWHRRMSTMMANAYRKTLAVDYMVASIEAFKDMGDVRNQGRTMQRLAMLFDHLDQKENARVTAQAVIELFDGPSYKGEEALADARKLLRDLDRADDSQ